MQELIKAVLEVMKEVKSIEKNLNVGTGGSSYKGVADKDVKLQIGQAMQKNGLVILPISVEPKTTVSEWDQESTYNGKTEMKHKTQVLTEVVTKYMLMHTSGEQMEIAGYGHGVDSQDKSAGKATTYALKYALLNTFLVPTGDIDDADSTHSDNYAQPPKQAQKKVLQKPVADDLTSVCHLHNVEMEQKSGAYGNYWSHKHVENNKNYFCNGKKLTESKY